VIATIAAKAAEFLLFTQWFAVGNVRALQGESRAIRKTGMRKASNG
jgi:hypothetical protein